MKRPMIGRETLPRELAVFLSIEKSDPQRGTISSHLDSTPAACEERLHDFAHLRHFQTLKELLDLSDSFVARLYVQRPV